MLAEDRVGIIAFVWRPEEIIPSVTEMAHRTRSHAIFDFSRMETQVLHSFVRHSPFHETMWLSIARLNGQRIGTEKP